MTQDLFWHAECLQNKKNYLAVLLQQQNDLGNKISEMIFDSEFYEKQILTAHEKGKTSFDREKFLKKRGVR